MEGHPGPGRNNRMLLVSKFFIFLNLVLIWFLELSDLSFSCAWAAAGSAGVAFHMVLVPEGEV